VSLSFNLFGESSFHQEAYTPARGYFAEGIESPSSWVFRRLYIDSSRAFKALLRLESVSLAGVMGMSQGAGISVWLGAFCPDVRCVVADMPFLAGARGILSGNYYRYPIKEIVDYIGDTPARREEVLRTMAFYDTVNVATRCQTPTLVTAGKKDPSVRPDQAEAVFRELLGPKEYELLDWGHDWHPSMVARNVAWLGRWTT
jgi:cephalosporin-C deacetylase